MKTRPNPLLRWKLFTALCVTVLACNTVIADPPPGYYDSAAGLSGTALRDALHEIINDHKVIPYSSTATDTSDALKVLDEDPGNANNVFLLYAQRTEAKSTFGLSSGWNREHMWCNSYGLDNIQPAFSDLHNLRAEDSNVNSARQNKYYDISNPSEAGYQNPAYSEAPLCSTDVNSWEPPTNVKGDIARALFYMDVRYEGDRANELDLVLTTNVILISESESLMGNLTVLLQWHAEDPVDAAERLRNDKVYQLYQTNRNPFVDFPDWVYSIFGGTPPAPSAPSINSQPQSQTVVAGGTVTLSVSASGTAPLSYQWKFNGGNISGATGSAYSKQNVQTGDAGNYSVLVSNSLGSQLSADATLTVTSGQPGTLAQWNFNSSSPDGNTATGSTGASVGSGTATVISASSTFAAGAASDPAASDNSGWNTASYPAQGTGNKTAGIQFSLSTAGYRDILISWEHRVSNTASKYARLQYSTDGINFIDHNVIAITTSNAFVLQSHDLSAITGINDNSNFSFRIVTEFENTATGSGTAGYVTASTSSYGTSGTIRFDMLTITATPIPVTPPNPPATPDDLAATAGDAQVTLSWSAVPDATTYKVKRSTSTGGPYTTIASSIVSPGYTDSSVLNETTYFYVVSAVNSGGESINSNEATATPQLTVPLAPTGLNAVGGNAVVDLTWTQSTSPSITHNNVYRSTTGSGGPYALIANLTATTSYSDTAVVNGTSYYYYVTAVNAGGESAPSTYRGATPSCPLPSVPSGLAATAGNAQVALTWSAVAGATGYNVKRSTTSGGPYSTLASGVASASYTDTTAVNGTTYHYVVSAVNACGESGNSSQVSATPSAPQGPAAPSNLTANPGKKKITLNWADNSNNESGFKIERSSNGVNFTQITTVTANTVSFTNTGLSSGATYYYRVRAYNANGDSAYSNTASARAQ
jgi:endonuclease I/fibronectin type 3 domain-containing protein